MSDVYDIFDAKKIKINGPINVLRLIGNIGGQAKVFYFFLDDQSPVSNQSQCLNVHSMDIHKYLVKTFSFLEKNEPDIICDFFVDMTPSQYRIDPGEREQIIQSQETIIDRISYSDQVIRLVSSAILYEMRGKQTQRSIIFPNVRLHYADIGGSMMNNIAGRLSLVNSLMKGPDLILDPSAYELLESTKQEISKYLRIYQMALQRPPISIPESYEAFARHLYKLLHSYNSPDIRRTIVEFLGQYFDNLGAISDLIDQTIKLFVATTHMYEHTERSYNRGLISYDLDKTKTELEIRARRIYGTRNLLVQAIDVINNITDCYLLRRLLDKSYITKALVYTSREKALHLVQLLVGSFDFSITSASHSTESIEKLNQDIHLRYQNNQPIADLLIYPDMPQCSDITDFPINLF